MKWLLVVCLLMSCRTKKEEDKKDLNSDEHAASNKTYLIVDPDQKIHHGTAGISNSGELTSEIRLHLDFFPNAQGNKASLPLCYDPLSVVQVIGLIVCSSGLNLPIKAQNINQICTVDAAKNRDKSAGMVNLKNCQHGQIYLYNLSPQVKVEVR